MTSRNSERHIPRRTFLAGAGASAAASMFLHPLLASAEGASPNRLLIVHRPCGTRPEQFFPVGGDVTNFTLSPILQSFEKIKGDMVILNEITCPRDPGWAGDQHAAGLITMMSGKKFVAIPGTDAAGDANAKNIAAADKTIDQIFLDKVPGMKRTVPSIQSAAYRPSSVGLPSFKVMSYTGPGGPLFPESRPETLFDQIFGSTMPALSPEAMNRLRAQNGSVLDFIHKDLTRLQKQVPQSQLPKLEAHLTGIRQLEASLATSGTSPGASCTKPTQVPLPMPASGVTIDEAQHVAVAQNQLAIIQTAFQCDISRVATFSFAHGNSDLRLVNVVPGFSNGGGHHTVSHDTTATNAQAQAEAFYCQTLSTFLQGMKAIPDGTGNLLDNTLVVFINECCIGATHSIDNMPILMFGGKSLKLQQGRNLHFNKSYMNDVWAAVAGAFGAPMAASGDTAFSKGRVTGLFGQLPWDVSNQRREP